MLWVLVKYVMDYIFIHDYVISCEESTTTKPFYQLLGHSLYINCQISEQDKVTISYLIQ